MKSTYEIWAADQSSTVRDQTALGLRGGFLWIWTDDAIQKTISNKKVLPLSCKPKPESGPWVGPCDWFDIFPGALAQQQGPTSPTGKTLNDLDNVGVWHGIVKDPSNKYVLFILFAKGGGYVGIIYTRTRGAVALFRVTKYQYTDPDLGSISNRSVHMTFWSAGNCTTCRSCLLTFCAAGVLYHDHPPSSRLKLQMVYLASWRICMAKPSSAST